MAPWAATLFPVLALLLLAALTGWGVALQRMTARLERDHPEAFATLRARSKRKAARMAVVSELQGALSKGETLPGAAERDPALARLAAREKALRQALLALSLALFAVFALG
jgi:ferric-dicitrate binding protein FerR (iron transport regulator)